MTEAFVHVEKVIDATMLEEIFTVCTWSERGSNKYQAEVETQTYWRDFLQDTEETGQLQQLLVFATGCDEIPTLGFDPNPVVTFGHKDLLATNNPTADFPEANTCANSLRLPVLGTCEEFKENMLSAITTASTF